jgi:glutamyl/glutaminyl-tRNA synthetase
MKVGKYKPGEAILRMKQDLDDPNPQMWDLIAYRVLLAPHHRTGDKWKVYPTYDFTHCLVDSFENISYVVSALRCSSRNLNVVQPLIMHRRVYCLPPIV